MKKVAFMYGKSVRLSDAVACYNAWKLLKAWYDAWDMDENRSHMEQYYSMSMKCQAWINGKARKQYEPVKPVVSVSEFGPSRTRYSGQIPIR